MLRDRAGGGRSSSAFARFDPDAPRLAPAEYTALVRRITRRPAWWTPLPPDRRIAVPGFASLHELSRDMEKAVKAGLRGRLWTLVHWSNWRMVFPHPHGQQERVAAEAVSELQAGRPVQLFITDFPWIKLNHSVLAYDYTERAPDMVDFAVFDPNDPQGPGVVRFDCRAQRFRPAPLCGVAVPQFRAFRAALLSSHRAAPFGQQGSLTRSRGKRLPPTQGETDGGPPARRQAPPPPLPATPLLPPRPPSLCAPLVISTRTSSSSPSGSRKNTRPVIRSGAADTSRSACGRIPTCTRGRPGKAAWCRGATGTD